MIQADKNIHHDVTHRQQTTKKKAGDRDDHPLPLLPSRQKTHEEDEYLYWD
jgi:hypothetical protein